MGIRKSSHDLRYEEYINRLKEEGFPTAYIRFYQLYAKYDCGWTSDSKKLYPELTSAEMEELKAFIARRGQIQIPEGVAEALYEKTWEDYEQYVLAHSPRISRAKYLDMIGAQYGMSSMTTAQITDVDLVEAIAREILFREMLTQES